MLVRSLFSLALLAGATVVSSAEADGADRPTEFRHEARVMGRLGNHPNVIHFIGEVTEAALVSDENPLAVDQMEWVESAAQNELMAPGTPDGVEAIAFEFFNLEKSTSVSSEGIVHRDIAARNFLVTTTAGSYASADGEFMLFGNDGGPSLRDSGVGPVRWMAPESLCLFSTDPSAGPDDFFEVLAGSSFTVNYAVPEPSAAALLLIAAGLPPRRRLRP